MLTFFDLHDYILFPHYRNVDGRLAFRMSAGQVLFSPVAMSEDCWTALVNREKWKITKLPFMLKKLDKRTV